MEIELTIEIENLAPTNGTLLTPVWFGIHNGTFDTDDRGRPVSPGLESLAEHGAVDLISRGFNLAGFGTGKVPFCRLGARHLLRRKMRIRES